MIQSFAFYKSLLMATILLLLSACGGGSSSSSDKPSYTGLWEDRSTWTEEISGNTTRSQRSGGSIEPLLIEDFGSYFMVTWCRARVQQRLDVIDSQITFPANGSQPAFTLELEDSASIYAEPTYKVNGLPRSAIHNVLKLSNIQQFDAGSASLSLSSSARPNVTELSGSSTSDTCVYSELEQTYDVSFEELQEIIDDPFQNAASVYFDTKTLSIITPLEVGEYANFTFSFRDEALIRVAGNGNTYDLQENATQFTLTYSEVTEFTGIENNQGISGSFTFDSYNFVAGFSLDLLESFNDPLSGELSSLLNTVGSFNATLEDGSIVTGEFEVTQ